MGFYVSLFVSRVVEIRRAQETDIPWLMSQLRDFYKFFGDTRIPLFPDEARAVVKLKYLIGDHLVFIAEKDGVGPCGFIGGLVTPHLFNEEILTLSELFWWVPESFRRSSVGLRLLDAFLDWGREHVDWITFALEHNSPVREETLSRRGFKQRERAYLLEVN